MKRQILLLLLALSCSLVHAEHSQDLSQELPSGQNHHITASDHIILSPGFKSEPQNGMEVCIEIDPYEVVPPKSGLFGGPFSGNDGVVGALEGTINVSDLGGAIYAIPIELPQGLGGLSPQMSICYNNQQRNGLLGWNWDLTGISAITRTGGKFYYDGYVSPVNYNDDRFCLDGQRLLNVSNNEYGANETQYRTEQDQLSKIVSYTEPDINGPAYFKVWTADGRILTYGNTSDSRALISSSNHVNVWLLKSVYDHYGNYITYHYETTADSYRLSQIEYSGNDPDEISPSYAVYFIYDYREDIDMVYHSDCMLKENVLLRYISVYNCDQHMFLYKFNFQAPDPQNGYPHPLLTSIEFKAKNEHLNPTVIEWGDNNYGITTLNNTKIPITTNTITSAFSHAVKFSGDFNGDGHTDVLAVRSNLDGSGTYHNEADLFINKGVSGDLIFDYKRSFELNELLNWIYVADFNGDGHDDILLTYRQRSLHALPDVINSTIYLSKVNEDFITTFTQHQLPSFLIRSDLLESLLIGDFLGEGQQSILIQSLKSSKSITEQSVLIRYDGNDFQLTEFSEHLDANRFYPADYNGDGAIEILFRNGQGFTEITKLSLANNVPHYTRLFHGNPTDWDDCFPGDFNADGNCDLLFYNSNSTPHWFISLANDMGISTQQYALPSSFPYENPGDYFFSLDRPNETYHFIKTGDFDGDGSSDLALLDGNTFHLYLGPIKTSGNEAPFSSSRHINTQLFQYFSNMDICLGNFLGKDNLSFLGNYSLSHLPSMTPRHEVEKITDGLGRAIEFQYDYLMPSPKNPSENDFYYLRSDAINPMNDIYVTPIPLHGLQKVTTYNIKNKPVSVECHYEGALLHKKGKGFLGFTKTIQKDYCNSQLQKRTVRKYDIEFLEQVMHPMLLEEEVFDKNGNLMASTWCTNQLFINQKNNKVFIPISDKAISEYDVDHPETLLKKEINETTVATHTDQLFKYNKTISVTTVKKGVTENPNVWHADYCDYLTTTATTYYADVIDSWLINRPKEIIETHHREGNYADISRKQHFTYTSSKLYQVSAITEFPHNGGNTQDPLTKKTEFQYDLTGNVISRTISAPYGNIPSRTELFEYAKYYGRRYLTKHVDAEGHATTFNYDNTYGYRTSMKDINQKETYYEQDPLGMTKRTIHPDGTVTCQATRWGLGGYYLWEKKTGQPTKTTVFASTGETVKELTYNLNGETVATTNEYDNFGRVEKVILPSNEDKPSQMIRYEYDPHHRVQKISHPDGTIEAMQYDGNRSSVTYETPEGEQQTESKTVNAMGWVVKSTDANGVNVIYDYYSDGKPQWTQIEGMDETRIEMDYNGFGNRISLFDPSYGLTTYEYNAFGELTRQVTPNLITTNYEYNLLGKKTRRVETDQRNRTSSCTQWTYSNAAGSVGLLKKIQTENQTINYDYDAKLRLLKVTENHSGENYITRYTYDDASRIASTTYPTNYTLHYCYSSEGQLRHISDDSAAILWRVDDADAKRIPTKITTGNGFVSTYDYVPVTNKIKSIRTLSGDKIIQDYSYVYDKFTNMTERLDLKNNNTEHFTYDPLNRLTSATDDLGTSLFTYDPLGRMISKTKSGQPVFSNANYSGPKPYAIKTATTEHGVFPQERMDIEYTSFGKVASIIEGENQITYHYGYDHQRIHATEVVEKQLREKSYANQCEFITQPDVERIERTFLSAPTGVFAVAETKNGSTSLHYIHKDHLGSWTTISDDNGTIEQENWYDAWGNNQNNDPPMFDRGFTGHEHIRGMNLINMNGRLYDPLTSSVISPDPYIQIPDFTQSFNRYAYCMNNPLTYVDPDGNSFIDAALIFYVVFCTDFGYEVQKEFLPLALHLDLHLSTQQLGLGLDASVGVPKQYAFSLRFHGGLSYYWHFYDNSFRGWEFRTGMEICLGGILGVSGTTYYFDGKKQTTNTLFVGEKWWEVNYENDYMFNALDEVVGFPHADNGDRYRSAAAKIRIGLFSVGTNLFTGDPGLDHNDRRTVVDPSNDKETYTIGANGEDPDQYRAGLLYASYGPVRLGVNSEQVRHIFQNRFAHDFLCRKKSPYFKVLDRPTRAYFYFGSGTGNSLW